MLPATQQKPRPRKSPDARLAEKLRRSRGFDKSYVSSSGGVRVGCSMCQALVINGVACHEKGCPNMRQQKRRIPGLGEFDEDDESEAD